MRFFPLSRKRLAIRVPAGWLALALLAGSSAPTTRADDWPQWLGPQRDGVWRESGILKAFPKEGPKIRWRYPVGMGYSGPAVAGGKVFVTDRLLDKGAENPESGFSRELVAGKERILCLEEATGKLVWKHEYPCTYEISYPAGPRATPLVAGGKVYTLGAMGDLLCLDANKGKVLWSKNIPREYKTVVPLWGYAASPLLDGDRLICLVGGAGSTVAAFHKDTGKELWKALSARGIGYCPPVIFKAGGKRQLIIWQPEALVSLNPADGSVYWSEKWNVRADLTIPTPRKDGDFLFLTSFYNGSMLLKLARDEPKATVVWKGKRFKARPGDEEPRRTDGLHSIMSTPVIKDGYVYGVCSYGQLRCLKEATGQRVWDTLAATGGKLMRWATVFIVAHGDRCFLLNDQGDLIIARLTPERYREISRAHVLDPTNTMARWGGNNDRRVLWSHPAFAGKAMFARNDKELVCVSLAAEK
jgi:outer membrane protein assembly factor BamB